MRIGHGEIPDAALRVFIEKGQDRARMDDVAAAAGLSTGSVSWHDKSQHGLPAAVLQRLLDMEGRRLDRVAIPQGLVADGLLAFVRRLAEDLRRVAPPMPLAPDFHAGARRRAWARRFLREQYGQYRDILHHIIQAGIDRGEFRPLSVHDTAVVLRAMLEGLILVWTVDGEAERLAHHADAGFRLLLDGLRRRPAA